MLTFNDVEIQLSITLKINNYWPKVLSFASGDGNNFTVSTANSDIAAYTAYPGKSVFDPVQRIALSSRLCPQLRYEEGQLYPTEGTLCLYENGFALFILSINVTQMQVKQINSLINRSFKENIYVYNNCICSIKSVAESVIKILYHDICSDINSISNLKIKFFEVFSIIHPNEFQPKEAFNDDVVGSEYEKELYEAAIRRMPDFSEARVDVARSEQKNASSYKGDLVYLNYHNLLVYVVPNKYHMQPQIYMDLVYSFKVYVANLSDIQSQITNRFWNINKVPRKLRKLRQESDWLDKVRLEYMRATENFDATIDVASVRISWFNDVAQKKFSISNKQQRITAGLSEFELFISRSLSLMQERHLQLISTILAVLSIIIAFFQF